MKPQERDTLRVERAKLFDKVVTNTTINCGESQEFVFTYSGDPKDLKGYKVGCRSCTKVKIEGNKVIVTFTAPPLKDYALKVAKGEQFENYTSVVTIYFDEANIMHRFSENGELVDNPDVVPVNLQVRAKIMFV